MSRRTLRLTESSQFQLRDSHPVSLAFPDHSLIMKFCNSIAKLGLFPFRSPLLRESLLLSFPTGTKMFQFPAYTFNHKINTNSSSWWVPPFGNPWIAAYLRLPKAYRCSSRPSSAPSAKAFTLRSLFLNFSTVLSTFQRPSFEKKNNLSNLMRNA